MLDEKKNKGDLLPYLANVNVRWGSFDLSALRQMRFEPREIERFGLKLGDIVMCEGGEPGRCAIWNEQLPGMMIQKAIHRIRPHDCLDNRFLFHTFLWMGMAGRFSPLFTGATIKHLPREKLALVKFDVPPLPVQHRIADVLSAYDELIETNRRRMALLEDAARQLYEEWFVRLRFPGHEHVRVVDGVPDTWERRTLDECLTLKRGHDLPASMRVDGIVPIVSSSGITGYHNEKRADGPGLVTGRYGTLGEVYYVEEDFWPHNTALYAVDLKGNSPRVLFYFLKHVLKGATSNNAAVPGLNRNVLHRLNVLWPSTNLLREFDGFLVPLFRQLSVLRRENDSLRKARDLLLPRLMSGELQV